MSAEVFTPSPQCPAQRHGTTRWYYSKHGCRCPEAVAASRAHDGWKGQEQRATSTPSVPDCPSQRSHGTRWARKQHGCRCPEAVAEIRAEWRASYHRRQQWRRTPDYSPATGKDGIVDEVVVERLTQGQDVPATKAERDAAYKLLEQRGLVAREIAERLRLSTRTVVRRRVAA